MVLSECYVFIKYALICMNFAFWAVGLTAVVLAIWMLTDHTFIVSLAQEEHNFNAGLYILLASGILLLVVAFLGCCGAFRESQCMLVGFFSCLLVVVVAQIAAGAWLYANRDRLEELLKSSVINTVKNEYGENESRTQTVDAFQSGLECCGVNGPSDWAGSKYANKNAIFSSTIKAFGILEVFKLPESCCKERDSLACKVARNVKVGALIDEPIYKEGCIDKLMDALKSQGNIVVGVVIGIVILELLGLIFSLVLFCAFGSSDRYKA